MRLRVDEFVLQLVQLLLCDLVGLHLLHVAVEDWNMRDVYFS